MEDVNLYKEKVKKIIRSLYLRVVIGHSYYHDLSYISDKGFDDALEIIYLIIEDVCKNENMDINDVKIIGNGGYSGVFVAGSKVIKFGIKRATMKFPNNPYVAAILLRKEIPINDSVSCFVEVTERVDDKSVISFEELYHLYKKLRDIHLIWLDVEKRNVGRLLRDNIIYWNSELPVTDDILGLDTYRGNELLKKGDIVILDNDLIYDEDNPNLLWQSSTGLQKKFERRYLSEKN